MKVAAHVVLQIAVTSHRHPKTVRAWFAGRSVRPIVDAVLRAACAELSIECPPSGELVGGLVVRGGIPR